MKHNQRATITSINNLNKNFEVKTTNYPSALEAADNGNLILPLPKGNLGDYFEIGDVIEFKKHDESGFDIINLSCEVLKISRFKRELNSILKRLEHDEHPLKRCILLNEDGYVLLSAKKNPEKLMLLQNQ
jgi:hypothetical protein